MERQIFYHDTDCGGVVYYANYLKYLEEARTEYMQEKGAPVQAFLDQGLLYAVRSCRVDYKAPARYGDVVSADARVEKLSGAQISFFQSVRDRASGKTLVEAEVVLVCLDKDFRPYPIPKNIREKLL